MTHVLVTMPFPDALLSRLRAVSPSARIDRLELRDGRWPDETPTMAEVIYGLAAFPPEQQSPALRWIQLHSAGVEHLLDTAVWQRDLTITTASGIHAPNIAQYVFAQLLAWANRTPDWLRHQARAEWPKNRWQKFSPTELRGQTLGILGYGSLGREIARLARAFGMAVLVTKGNARHIEDEGYVLPNTGDPEGRLPDRIYPPEATRSMLAECDFVVVTLPLTTKTHHLLDEEMFKAMKPASFLVNVGRGSIIYEEHLVKALKKGWIAGAGLDVFETEPLPQKSPLWTMENVILTPHISGFTPHYDDRAVDLFAENLRRYRTGEPLLNVVDRDRGY